MPEVIVKKITDFDDVNWIMEKLSWRSGPTPTFVLMSPDFSTEYDRFSGYSDWKSFESELSKAIRSIPEKINSKNSKNISIWLIARFFHSRCPICLTLRRVFPLL